MNKGRRYDEMVSSKQNDELGLFDGYDQMLDQIRESVLEINAKRVLDIGCGTGNLCGPISEKIYVLGIDKNIEMIEWGISKFPNMNFEIENFLELKVNESSFDVVVSTLTCHGIIKEKQIEFIENLISYAKSGGKIIIADYMFLNQSEREVYLESLREKPELLDFVKSKNYMVIDEFEKKINFLNLNIKNTQITNLLWVIELTK